MCFLMCGGRGLSGGVVAGGGGGGGGGDAAAAAAAAAAVDLALAHLSVSRPPSRKGAMSLQTDR